MQWLAGNRTKTPLPAATCGRIEGAILPHHARAELGAFTVAQHAGRIVVASSGAVVLGNPSVSAAALIRSAIFTLLVFVRERRLCCLPEDRRLLRQQQAGHSDRPSITHAPAS